jgi:hypothetical protein
LPTFAFLHFGFFERIKIETEVDALSKADDENHGKTKITRPKLHGARVFAACRPNGRKG